MTDLFHLSHLKSKGVPLTKTIQVNVALSPTCTVLFFRRHVCRIGADRGLAVEKREDNFEEKVLEALKILLHDVQIRSQKKKFQTLTNLQNLENYDSLCVPNCSKKTCGYSSGWHTICLACLYR